MHALMVQAATNGDSVDKISQSNAANNKVDKTSIMHIIMMILCHDSPKTSLCAGGTHLTVFGRSLATHLSIGLPSRDLERISTQIYEDTNKWLLALFKYVNHSECLM